MVCSKLMDEGWQSINIHLIVEERQLKLCDVDGVFLEGYTEDASKEPLSERRRVRRSHSQRKTSVETI